MAGTLVRSAPAWVAAIFAALALPGVARAAPRCEGVVHDAASRTGIPGVQVSDGTQVVLTDARGRYGFTRAGDGEVFVIKPAGYAVPLRANNMPDFWRNDCGDFTLRRSVRASDTMHVLLFGDPQPKTMRDVDYFARDIVASAKPRAKGAAFGVSLGDIVDNDTSLYPAVRAATATLGVPWLHAPGNHDIDADAKDDAGSLHAFRQAFGPDTFAWEEDLASIVVLDDVVARPGQSPSYIGGLRDAQFAFLQARLARVPRDRLLIVAAHIPFFETGDPAAQGGETFRDADRQRLFALLQPFPHVLLLSAHTHEQKHYVHTAADGWHGAQPLHEYNVGAACGAYWSGVKDAAGIPAATMADGTPNGFATLDVQRGGAYALAWHPARDPADSAMALHAPKVLRRGAYPGWGVYANVFMGQADTRVEYRVDGGAWKPMVRVLQPDPALVEENVRDDEATRLRGFDRSPEATVSTHLWRGALPTKLASGEHRVEVRAFDAGRGEVTASTTYTLLDAAN